MEEKAEFHLMGRASQEPRTVGAAILAGQLGGLAFLAFLCLVYLAFFPAFPWHWPIQVVASFALGGGALFAPTALTYVLGVALNQAVALFWSAALAWFAIGPLFSPRLSTHVVAGLILGFLAAFTDIYLLVPPLFGVLQDLDYWWVYLDRQWDWLAHLAFGLTTGWFFHVFRSRGRLRERRGGASYRPLGPTSEEAPAYRSRPRSIPAGE